LGDFHVKHFVFFKLVCLFHTSTSITGPGSEPPRNSRIKNNDVGQWCQRGNVTKNVAQNMVMVVD
jgi:hypothetical protein